MTFGSLLQGRFAARRMIVMAEEIEKKQQIPRRPGSALRAPGLLGMTALYILAQAVVIVVLLCVALIGPTAFGQGEKPAAKSPPSDRRAGPLIARVGDTGFVRVQADSFQSLSPKQKALAYWLTQASIAIDPIVYDQLSRFGLRQKRLLEEIVAHPAGIDSQVMARIVEFTERFWANRGNHNDYTAQKFLPSFHFDELKQAALVAQRHGAMKTAYGDLLPIATRAQLEKELDELRASFFDPDFEPMTTAKSPKPGLDILQASSNTFYEGVSLVDLKDFREEHPLNSRVVKDRDGKLREEVYRAGTPDGKIPPGLYATYLKKAIGYLEKARALADPPQAQVIADLIRYYQTGESKDWLRFGTDWVQNNATVDFANGFIEVYHDARGAKGSSQSFVSVTDKPVTDEMTKLARNAEYFEQKAPWDARYKKRSFQPPVVKAVETLIETGDFGVTTVGDNLPNENEIHEKYGTKNFLFTGSSRTLNQAVGSSALEEFAASPEEIARARKYGDEADDLMTALHEVIGHGSGKLSERLAGGAERALKEYFSTLEEGRADLMALWNVWDPKLKELGLIRDQEEVAKAMYDSAARVALAQLRRIPQGDTIEEDHQRDRQLIARYVMDKTGGIEQFERGGKTYVRVKDYAKMREGVGLLLAELMRIKAEGDYDAIKALVDKYGVHFDPALRDQIVARYRTLNLPTNWAGINARLTARFGKGGRIEKVEIAYPRDPASQYLGYAAMYDKGLLHAEPAQ
jgi:dipeptidyl-peptidase-3